MSKKKLSKLLALYLPYVVIGLVATNLGEAWRLAAGKELGDKIVSLMDTLPAAFSNPLPSLHPLDLLVGLCCGAAMRLAVYLKGKNAKKYRHGMEYGSARCLAFPAMLRSFAPQQGLRSGGTRLVKPAKAVQPCPRKGRHLDPHLWCWSSVR